MAFIVWWNVRMIAFNVEGMNPKTQSVTQILYWNKNIYIWNNDQAWNSFKSYIKKNIFP